MHQPQPSSHPRVVVIGAGFGGLQAARALRLAPVDVLLIDRNNYHGFWPLLYQVAAAGLEPQQIAQPVRAIIRHQSNLRFQMAQVSAIDRQQRRVITSVGNLPYDELIVAPGSVTNFFGMEQVRQASFELKDVPDAVALRNHIITCFEHAASTTDPTMIHRRLTFVVVGGGPTGVELAGAISELVRHVLRHDFPTLDFSSVRIVLLEAMDRVLLAFPERLAQTSQRKLEQLGVELRLNTTVADYTNGLLRFKDGSSLPTDTVVWSAGIQGSPLGNTLNVPLQRGSRVEVKPTLQLPDDPNVWVIGDLAYLPGPDGKPYPQLATVAMQQGRHVAQNIQRRLAGQPLIPFTYTDKGSMATVGRRFAVAQIWKMRFSGTIAWVLWLAVHLYYLIGFRNRLGVLINWAYNYVTYDRGSRALVEAGAVPVVSAENTQTDQAEPETVLARDRGA